MRPDPKEARAFPEMLRAVAGWPQWMDRNGLDFHCRTLYREQPELCNRYIRQESPFWPDSRRSSGPLIRPELGNPLMLREQLANDGLVAYHPARRVVFICVRPEGQPEADGKKHPERGTLAARVGLCPWSWGRGLYLKPAGEMLRAVAAWPKRLTLEEVGERCRELTATRPLLCADFVAGETDNEALKRRINPRSWIGGPLRADDWRTIRRHLALLGLIKFDPESRQVAVRAYHPGPPMHLSLPRRWAAHDSSRPRWHSQLSERLLEYRLLAKEATARGGRTHPPHRFRVSAAGLALERMREFRRAEPNGVGPLMEYSR